MKSLKNILFVSLIIIVFTSCTSQFYFDFASARKPTSSCAEPRNPDSLKAKNVMFWSHDWILNTEHETVEITSYDNLRLSASFVRAPQSNKAVILAHGYTGCGYDMSEIARVYREEYGYSVLMCDARAHGKSEGEYIGFGWLDRLDYARWIGWLISEIGEDCSIVMHGISMGGATVLMTAGEKLPENVKAVISDCAFTSVYDEVSYVMKRWYRIHNEELLKEVSRKSKQTAGYSFEEASTLEQVKKISIPVLFIHGEDDNFIPLWMVYALYDACSSQKELFTVPYAKHATSSRVDPENYKHTVEQFLSSVM